MIETICLNMYLLVDKELTCIRTGIKKDGPILEQGSISCSTDESIHNSRCGPICGTSAVRTLKTRQLAS